MNLQEGVTVKTMKKMCKLLKLNNFMGVWLAEKLKYTNRFNKQRFSIIVLFTRYPGSLRGHYVTIVGYPTKIVYIDSLGKKCTDEDILLFLSSFKRPIEWSKRKVQHRRSGYCGLFAMFFVYFFDKNKRDKIKFVKKNIRKNDMLVMKYLKKAVNKTI